MVVVIVVYNLRRTKPGIPTPYKRPKWCGQNGVHWLYIHLKFPTASKPDQQSQCVFRLNGNVLSNIMKSFTSEPVPTVDPGTIVIKESKTGGLGVFALRNIKRGQLILAERATSRCLSHGLCI